MKMRMVLILCALVASRPAMTATAAPQRLVPAVNPGQKTDSLGFRWQLEPSYGNMRYGTNNCFRCLNRLMINGNNFCAQQQQMTADGSEYILSGNVSGIDVTRRVRLDLKDGVVRYADIFRNGTHQKTTLSVALYTELGRNCQSLVSDRGAPVTGGLGKDDGGLVTVHQPGSGCPAVLWWLADPKSKAKPSLNNNSSYDFSLTYVLEIEAGKTAALVHSAAQRNLSSADAKTLSAVFGPLKSRLFSRDLPADIRRSIVNQRSTGFSGFGGAKLLAAVEGLEVERTGNDVLALGADTRLAGMATCARLSVESAYGPMEVAFEKVAALTGRRYGGQSSLVFLRDGQVLAGAIRLEGLKFSMTSGPEIPLTIEAVDRIVMRALPEDGKAPAEASGLLETFSGDRLFLTGGGPRIEVMTRWGPREVGIEDIAALNAVEEDLVGYRFELQDGNRFFCFISPEPLEMTTLFFGARKIYPTEIRSLLSLQRKREADKEPAHLDQPHLVLAGENILVGRIDLPAIHFVSAGEVIPVPPDQLKAMRNTSDEQMETRASAVFSAELWGGGILSGTLKETVLPVRSGDTVWRIPSADVVEVCVPTPSIPEGLREKLARYIRDLGHPDWEKREEASRLIAEIGYLAKPQLEDAYRQTQDPEVRKRVRTLLDEMKE